MLKVSRLEQIFKILQEKKVASFQELSKYFNVSTSTIRRDLADLSKNYPVSFTHGGVVYTVDNPIIATNNEVRDKKLMKIGEKAVTLIEENDIIIIDSGRTTAELAKAVANANISKLTIITTSIAIANIICTPSSKYNIIIIGGEYRDNYRSLIGPIAEETIRNIKVDKTFIGTTGICEKGFFTPFISEINLRKSACSSAKELILLTDDSKFNNQSGFIVNPLDSINKIVTNSVPPEWEQILKDKNIEIILS